MKKSFQLVLASLLLLFVQSTPALAAPDAVLSFTQTPGTICVGRDTAFSIRVNTGSNNNVSTVTPYFEYDPAFFALQGTVSTSGGAFPEVYRNNPTSSGLVELSMSGQPQSGSNLLVASFSLRPTRSGTTTLRFDSKATVLISDNTPVLGSAQTLSITINQNCSGSSSGGGSSGGSGGGGSSGGGGGGGTISHLACVNNQCTRVAGLGADECSRVGTGCSSSGSSSGSSGSGTGTGSSSGSSSGSGGVSPDELDPQCEQPVNVHAASNNDGSVELRWENNDSRVSAFEVRYGTESSNYTKTEFTANIRSLLITGLEKGRTYFFSVVAFGECNASNPSNEVSVQAQAGSTGIGSGKPAAGTGALPPRSTSAGAALTIPALIVTGITTFLVRKKKKPSA